jgi:hypothetical protein
MLPAKPKCMFLVTALAKPLMMIDSILIKAMLLHLVYVGCIQIFTLIEEFSPFRPERVKREKNLLHVTWFP